MKVGIVGVGSLGVALAGRLRVAGHRVMLSYSRDAEKLAVTAAGLGVGHGEPAVVRMWADVVALAVRGPRSLMRLRASAI